MDVISRSAPSSTLNPNAPMFVPAVYRAVEDFSEEWWALVHSSPWFRDYWLQERFLDPQTQLPFFDDDDDSVLADLVDCFFESNTIVNQEAHGDDSQRDLVSLGALKWWRKARSSAEAPRYIEKPPKTVNVKVNPRPIQQPR